MTRQESECEPLGGLWRLKCGKSGQERQGDYGFTTTEERKNK